MKNLFRLPFILGILVVSFFAGVFSQTNLPLLGSTVVQAQSTEIGCDAHVSGVSVKNYTGEYKTVDISWLAVYCDDNPGHTCQQGPNRENARTLAPYETLSLSPINSPPVCQPWAFQSDVDVNFTGNGGVICHDGFSTYGGSYCPTPTPTMAPSCTISASPNPCIYNPNATTCPGGKCCNSQISWNTNSNMSVYVEMDNGAFNGLYGQSGPGSASGNAPWIQCDHTYVFKGIINGNEMCRVNVSASCPTATPTPTVTVIPTSTPRPTATPTPTATPRPTATPTPTIVQPTPTPTISSCVMGGRQANYGQTSGWLTIKPLKQVFTLHGWDKTWEVKGLAGKKISATVNIYNCEGYRRGPISGFDLCLWDRATSSRKQVVDFTIPASGVTTFTVTDSVDCCQINQADLTSVNGIPWRSSFFLRWSEASYCSWKGYR